TTQLCLELLETYIPGQSSILEPQPAIRNLPSAIRHPPSAIIDVGCGSGILSIAALKLGAASALGVDIDEAAVKASRENAAANGVAENLSLGLGSVAEVLAGRFGVRQASLVLANILAPVIIRLFEAGLDELVAPDGALILSGILQEQVESVVSAARSRGMKLVEKRQMGDWVAMRLER
ncbi:MAG: 50S ribosomal protein L11 methyltransferase, partial [Anaerolineales bacterium]|nr:50S ribosomal protein L11 methyltransferase [Anaerolineales bacterium]